MPDMISTKEAAALIGWTPEYLRVVRCHNSGPEYVKVNKSRVEYSREVVLAWVEQRKREKIAAILEG